MIASQLDAGGRALLKQPHEGIVGEPRDPHLLSLDDAARPTRRLLFDLAVQRARAELRPPGDTFERLSKPQPGQLVVVSDAYRRADAGLHSFGYLVESRLEWWHTDEEWARQLRDEEVYPDEERLVDRAWYVQYGPGPSDICRWVNCTVWAVEL